METNLADKISLKNIKWFIDKALDFIYPSKCLCCGFIINIDSEIRICEDCKEHIKIIEKPCLKCGGNIEETHSCESCLHIIKDYYYRNYSFMEYDDVSKTMLFKFKYSKYKFYGKHIVNFINANMDLKFFDYYDMIIPVPLHKKRLRQRGFNQAKVLGEELSLLTGTNIVSNVLCRQKDTAKQSQLPPAERKKNLEDAFVVKNKNIIKAKKILVVDDIFTTGATISAAAKVLLENGADMVSSFTIAKTVH